MQFYSATPLCINRYKGDSINAQISGANCGLVGIHRCYHYNGGESTVAFTVQFNKALLDQLHHNGLVVCYFPDTQRREDYKLGEDRLVLQWSTAQKDRYCNLLMIDGSRNILYANTLVFSSSRAAVYEDSVLSSNYRVTESNLHLDGKGFSVCLHTDRPVVQSRAVLQTNCRSLDLLVFQSGNELTVEFDQAEKLHSEIWMLCIEDENAKFLSQACFYVA